VGSFRGLKKQVVEKILTEHTSFVYITAITLKHVKNIGNVTVEHAGRKYGSSNYSYYKLINLFYKLFINYSGLPIKPRKNELPQYIIKHIGF
jgi:undecaprenyl-phosphate 4-deoxy-4-formamido-L-arabinose transferase